MNWPPCHYKITRQRTLPHAGNKTALFVVHGLRQNQLLLPDQVPDFDGDEAWFEIDLSAPGGPRIERRTDERGKPLSV